MLQSKWLEAGHRGSSISILLGIHAYKRYLSSPRLVLLASITSSKRRFLFLSIRPYTYPRSSFIPFICNIELHITPTCFTPGQSNPIKPLQLSPTEPRFHRFSIVRMFQVDSYAPRKPIEGLQRPKKHPKIPFQLHMINVPRGTSSVLLSL